MPFLLSSFSSLPLTAELVPAGQLTTTAEAKLGFPVQDYLTSLTVARSCRLPGRIIPGKRGMKGVSSNCYQTTSGFGKFLGRVVTCGLNSVEDQGFVKMSGKSNRMAAILGKIAVQGRGLPSLVVFDLDYTLWPFYCDCMSMSSKPWLFPEVMGVIGALQQAGVPMALASRTETPDIAQSFLNTLGISDIFPIKEMYPTHTHKTEHFAAIQKKTGVPYTEMLFFDDEERNTRTIKTLGVTCILVDDTGVCLESVRQGLQKYSLS